MPRSSYHYSMCLEVTDTDISSTTHKQLKGKRLQSESQELRKQGNSYCADYKHLKCLEKKHFGFIPDPESTSICQRGGEVRVEMLMEAAITSSSFSSKIARRFSGTNSLRPGREEERRAARAILWDIKAERSGKQTACYLSGSDPLPL